MRASFLSLLFASTIALAPLGALTVAPATFEELVRESVAVVHGRVRDVRASWTSDRRTIQSAVTVEVMTSLKGADVETTTFVVPGGEAGGRLLVVPGAPTFRVGDEVVLFLAGRAPSLPQPVGLSLGVYRVTRQGQAPMVVPSPIHEAVAGPVRRGAATRAPRTLTSFAADVRRLAEGK